MTNVPEQFDVIVVGGGPAGSCLAGLLALEGRRVVVVEREKFPRYHIGESLITGVWPTLDRLGVRERCERLGFVKKYGATILWGKDQEFWSFAFRQSGEYEFVHQVPRAEFDAMLLDRARELGVQVLGDATVKEPILEGDRLAGLRYQLHGQEGMAEIRAKLIVDASGQSHWLGKLFDLVEWHEDLRNIAVWSYYQGGKRYDGELAGNTLIECVQGGWLWFIPLANDLTSVGYVTTVAHMNETGIRIEKLFDAVLDDAVEVTRMLAGSTRVNSFRTIRDWSYTCKRFHGPGWVLVGDAAAFVDPLLSTGVTLAVRGARVAAKAVNMALDDPSIEPAVMQVYEDNSRAFLDVILEFVRFFYDQTKTRVEYYEGAQDIIDPRKEAPPDFDFVKLVSGLAYEDEDAQLAKVRAKPVEAAVHA
jgi:flavin-dependent dehydrogenase